MGMECSSEGNNDDFEFASAGPKNYGWPEVFAHQLELTWYQNTFEFCMMQTSTCTCQGKNNNIFVACFTTCWARGCFCSGRHSTDRPSHWTLLWRLFQQGLVQSDCNGVKRLQLTPSFVLFLCQSFVGPFEGKEEPMRGRFCNRVTMKDYQSGLIILVQYQFNIHGLQSMGSKASTAKEGRIRDGVLRPR